MMECLLERNNRESTDHNRYIEMPKNNFSGGFQ